MLVVVSRRRGRRVREREREREKLTEGASCEEKTERDGIERLCEGWKRRGEGEEGQSGSGNDRPSALEANIDECPALLALRNRGTWNRSLSPPLPPVSFCEMLSSTRNRERLKRSQAETERE